MIWVAIGIVIVVVVIACLAAKNRNEAENARKRATEEQNRRRLKNLVIKMPYEAFRWFLDQLHSSNDFEGAFAIHNSTQDKWYVDSAQKVFGEAKRVFDEHPEIIRDQEANCFFSVRIVPLSATRILYPTSKTLCNALDRAYVAGKNKYL